MRSHWLRLLAALLAFSLIAAACGGDDDDDPVATGDDGGEEATDDGGEEATDDGEEATDDGEGDDAMAEDDGGEEATDDGEEAEDDGGEEEPAPEEPAFDPAVCGELGDENGPSGAAEGALPDGAGGTLLWAHEQEPPDMHLDDPNNNLSITAWLRQALLDGLYGVDSTTSFYPELLASEAEVVDNGDGSVTINYVLRDGLTWSDGTALTSRDVQYTCRIILDPNYLIGDRSGYDLITSFEVASDTEFSVTLSQFFAGFPTMFSEVYPSHALGADGTEANANFPEFVGVSGETLPSSGPMLFTEWERGVSMTMTRNTLYHGSAAPDVENTGLSYVDELQINWVPDTDAQVNALLAGESHLIMTQPQLAFETLASNEDFTVASSAGPVFEHWGINLLNPHLADPAVREALALAMNKADVMAGLYTPLFGDALPADGLGNTFWMSNQTAYENHAGDAGYGAGDADAARALLEGAGYVDNGGVYEHPERGRLTLRVGTTGGNELRELQQQLLQAAFGNAGIEITIDNVPGADYFGERPFAEQAIAASTTQGAEGDPTIWDLTQFAWVGGPWPGGQAASYKCGNGNNPYGYCNPEFDARADECDGTIDNDERAACYNELDRYVTTLEIDAENGLFMLPITQKPSFYGYLSSVLDQNGATGDANRAGPIANIVDYRFG